MLHFRRNDTGPGNVLKPKRQTKFRARLIRKSRLAQHAHRQNGLEEPADGPVLPTTTSRYPIQRRVNLRQQVSPVPTPPDRRKNPINFDPPVPYTEGRSPDSGISRVWVDNASTRLVASFDIMVYLLWKIIHRRVRTQFSALVPAPVRISGNFTAGMADHRTSVLPSDTFSRAGFRPTSPGRYRSHTAAVPSLDALSSISRS